MGKINEKFYSKLTASLIFKNDTIYKLSLYLKSNSLREKNYQTIVELNSSNSKKNMFMIHPGLAGCEVYTSLANILSDYYKCFGVDSYNLYHKNKISKLHDLAKFYLKSIDEIMIKSQEDVYHILGWSLGGKIALEISCILEQRGCKKIKLYLLDPIINDEMAKSMLRKIGLKQLQNEYAAYNASQGYSELYISRMKQNLEVENKLGMQNVSGKLTYTDVLLFKAMLQDQNMDENNIKIYEYLKSLKNNNLETCIVSLEKIKKIELNSAHHHNILDPLSLLLSEIMSWGAC